MYFALAGLAFERIVRAPATRAGQVFQNASLTMHVTVVQTLQGIKEVKVRRTSAYFLDRYDRERRRYARARRVSTFLTDLPRYALELVFVGGVAVLTAVTLAQGNSATTLTTLALFLAAGFRMLPSLVRIVASLQMIRTGIPAVQLVLDDVRSTDLLDAPADDPRETRRTPLRDRLEVEDVTYRYPGSAATVLDGVSLSVAAGTSVALVGTSGAGKTTLVDVVLGLHQPEHGRVLVDGVPIDDDLRGLAAQHRTGAAGRLPHRRHAARQHRPRRARRHGRRGADGAGRADGPARRPRGRPARRAWTPSSASAVPG